MPSETKHREAEGYAHHVSLYHRSAAAIGASVISAFVVNPLDVVKTRLQAQRPVLLDAVTSSHGRMRSPEQKTIWKTTSLGGGGGGGAADGSKCNGVGADGSKYGGGKIMGTPNQGGMVPGGAASSPTSTRLHMRHTVSRDSAGVCAQDIGKSVVYKTQRGPMVYYTGTWDALTKIAKTEGIQTLWKGTGLSLVMALPMVGIYLPLYDSMLEYTQNKGLGMYAPLVAGTLSRSIAVYCTSPIELLRVRVQAVQTTSQPSNAVACSYGGYRSAYVPLSTNGYGMGTLMARMAQLRHLWTGVGATLLRDVPFSGLYWALVEPIRSNLLPHGAHSEMDVFIANSVAGGVAGALAAAVTTPFDVAKTRMQLYQDRAMTTSTMLKDIFMTEGMAGLYRGWSARSAKAVPACAIVLSAYEMIKFLPMDYLEN